jgi:hypothetical protein
MVLQVVLTKANKAYSCCSNIGVCRVFKPAIMQRAGVAFDRPIVEERESQLVPQQSLENLNTFFLVTKQGSSNNKKNKFTVYERGKKIFSTGIGPINNH